jgi:hypothetical protein
MLLAMSCAHNVAQDAATGADGKTKGARNITLENGEGKAMGIVTYPGGDRVDWKVVELPDKSIGTLNIELKWTPPRPGLQLAFDVFDEWNQPIVVSKKVGKHKAGRVRTATVEKGAMNKKYFIRVYAPNRGDAGKYKLTLDFHESADTKIDWAKVDIPDPPKLAAVPENEYVCDDTSFDPKRRECLSFCPSAGAPQNWPGCRGHCPSPPDPNNKDCWDQICPNPPVREARACMREPLKHWPKCPDPNNPDADNPNCDHATVGPQSSRVVSVSVQGSDTLITIPIGSEKGVATSWKGMLLRGDSTDPLPDGEIEIVRVAAKQTLGKVHLTPDQVNRNLRVKLTPPPK